ncbi:unnamed protein product [Rotaria socialis]|uniref:Uncharacterized protein n=1 Tax=Rotaria socialis TaxID=392032 RepID=A0A820IT53_9BILA|nr:unnamed protein product [Rotaria socialis]
MAIHFYEKSLEISRQILSPNHHYLASSYNGIGMAYMKKGVYVEALSSHEKSLQMFEKTLGPNDCHVSISDVHQLALSIIETTNSLEEINILDFFEKRLESVSPKIPMSYITRKFNSLTNVQYNGSFQNICQHHVGSSVSNNLSPNMLTSSHNFSQINNSLTEPITIDNAILTATLSQANDQFYLNESMPVEVRDHSNQSLTVTPVNCTSNTNVHIESRITNDLIFTQQYLQSEIIKPYQIHIKAQPRSKFRPRTQNESKTTSHYLRCEANAELEYPAIYVRQEWARESDTNIIEVSLMDIEKKPHLYTLDNKTRMKQPDDQLLIFKQEEVNTLYFIVTNQDFINGYKSFMMELIKSKQDDIITKKVIRSQKLDQSLLRFTRIYRDQHGEYQRDKNSEVFSCTMQESYGDVSVENMSPQYGPMCGQTMVFIVFKGRITKDNLSFIICEPTTDSSEKIKKFTLNGTIVYFPMPSAPFPSMNNIKVSIQIYFKNERIRELDYVYMNFSDQVTNVDCTQSMSDIGNFTTTITLTQDGATNIQCMPKLAKNLSKRKPNKRLNSKND